MSELPRRPPRFAPARLAALLIALPPLVPATARGQAPRDSDPEPLQAVLARVVTAYGGTSAVAATSRMLQRGSVTSRMHAGAEGRIQRFFEGPARLRVEIEYPGAAAEVRIINGRDGWRNGLRSTGPMYAAMLLQAARLGLPGVLDAFDDRLADLGEIERDGARRRAIALDFHDGLRLVVEVDVESGRILRSEGRVIGSRGAPALSFATEYDDFRYVDGSLVPFHETNFAQGVRTGETRLEAVDLVGEMPEETFQPRTTTDRPGGEPVRT